MKKQKAPKDDPMWDTLNEMGAMMDQLISETVQRIVPFLNNRELNAAVSDGPTLLNWAKIYQRDIVEYQERLNKIRETHVGKKGAPTADEYFLCFQLYEQYVAWQGDFNSVVLPNVQSILDLYIAAGDKLEAARTPQQETPDVP